LMVQVIREILDPSRDVIRTRRKLPEADLPSGPPGSEHTSQTVPTTDPLGGIINDRRDAFTLPGLGRSTSLKFRW
jgi:hypothetical protein